MKFLRRLFAIDSGSAHNEPLKLFAHITRPPGDSESCGWMTECLRCRSRIDFLYIFIRHSCFYFYPGEGYARGERIPLLYFSCPNCGYGQYIALFLEWTETGTFGCSPVMDPIPDEKINAKVAFRLVEIPERVARAEEKDFYVPYGGI
jgi:hypothetical protein